MEMTTTTKIAVDATSATVTLTSVQNSAIRDLFIQPLLRPQNFRASHRQPTRKRLVNSTRSLWKTQTKTKKVGTAQGDWRPQGYALLQCRRRNSEGGQILGGVVVETVEDEPSLWRPQEREDAIRSPRPRLRG